jgi:putative tryptophan/tyrosine transport system substrate-binding protein
MIDRRRFLLTSLAALAAALAAEAQPAGRMYRIGYLGEGMSENALVLEEALRELGSLGYVEGRNLVVERRFAAFKYDRLPDLAAELVRLKPDVLVTGGNPGIAALRQATATAPIVMAWASDPVGAGLVTSLARPGGNITGLTLGTGPEFITKELQILNEVVPKLSRVAILRETDARGPAETAALESAARKLGLTILFADIRTPSDIAGAFATIVRSRAGAILILGGNTTWASRQQLADMAMQHRLPSMCLFRGYAEAGLLLTYGPDRKDLNRRAAAYIDKILKGARPADLPVAEPTKFELVINLKAAKALGLTIPPSVLARADQVIE